MKKLLLFGLLLISGASLYAMEEEYTTEEEDAWEWEDVYVDFSNFKPEKPEECVLPSDQEVLQQEKETVREDQEAPRESVPRSRRSKNKGSKGSTLRNFLKKPLKTGTEVSDTNNTIRERSNTYSGSQWDQNSNKKLAPQELWKNLVRFEQLQQAKDNKNQSLGTIKDIMQERKQILDTLSGYEQYINTQNARGRTPLMFALQKEDPKLIQKLITIGADPDVPDNKGKTTRDILEEQLIALEAQLAALDVRYTELCAIKNLFPKTK